MPAPTWLEIAKGPIFRFALIVLILGLARIVFLSLWGMIAAIRRAGDHKLPYGQVLKETLTWLFPFTRMHQTRPVHGYASFIFHLGIIFAGLFLQSHIDIVQFNLGLAWPAIPRLVLDVLTLATIVAGAYILLYRVYAHSARSLSTLIDYVLLLIILNIFVSGFVAGRSWNPIPYDSMMLFHTLNGIVLLVLIPFTKIAHCILFPLIRLGSEIGWHLTPQGGTDVVRTLYGSEGRKI